MSPVPFAQALRFWLKLGFISFGGPAGQIAIMHRELVEQRRWISERRFLHALNYCMLLPGPEATQLAVYVGWLLNGAIGGVIAGVLFVLPGVVALLALSALYAGFGETALVAGLFAGLAPAVVAVVVQAVVRIGRRVLHHPLLVALAVAAFLALAVFQVPFPLVVLGAGLVGAVVHRWRPDVVSMPEESADPDDEPPLVSDDALHAARPTGRRAALVLGIGIPLWLLPVAVAGLLAGGDSVYAQQGLFFSGTALVTFGGAYAVLSFVAQRAVEVYGWLAPGEMARGLALAETTPGPLIMVVQFVAFLGAFRDPGALDPWTAGVVASLLTTWVTFVPCFLFIFLGAPYVERLRGNAALSAAMTGITAAVVGVIANLGVYFATHTLFDESHRAAFGPLTVEVPDLSTLDPVALGVAAMAAVLLLRLRWSVLRTLAVCALVGLVAQFLI